MTETIRVSTKNGDPNWIIQSDNQAERRRETFSLKTYLLHVKPNFQSDLDQIRFWLSDRLSLNLQNVVFKFNFVTRK